ncbi:hypothetical protein L6452_05765 [Arctium lappa]|uniref:Uncharacterized protein n=1 Tax=Arctium lappa TaxID=4217 RepID=A0ACB9EH95_ARCLA|nr:hypothetical protein L6452_05765 [Arctium lappa]
MGRSVFSLARRSTDKSSSLSCFCCCLDGGRIVGFYSMFEDDVGYVTGGVFIRCSSNSYWTGYFRWCAWIWLGDGKRSWPGDADCGLTTVVVGLVASALW